MNIIKKLVPQFLKNIYHLMQAILANIIYWFPSREIRVIGITGTNGKTTTVQMTAKILEEAGYKVAVASTINFKIGECEWVNKTKYTTLSSFATQKFIKEAVMAGCDYLVLETSSHSLHQYRVWGVRYDVAAITNVTREHLDYHKNLEKYAQAKNILFKMVESSQKSVKSIKSASGNLSDSGQRSCVVNLDMDNPELFLKNKVENKIVCTLQNKNAPQNCKLVKAENIQIGLNGSKFTVGGVQFELNIPGTFNIENALTATSIGLCQGIGLDKCSNALSKIQGVPGRMEAVPNNKGLDIIVDYAVTPDSLEKLYSFISEYVRKSKNVDACRIIAVFGSCGDRDRGKRPIMGEIVAKYAHYIIVTNEDPYGEDPIRIINEVFTGVVGKKVKGDLPNYDDKEFVRNRPQVTKVEGGNAWRIMDRREAIRKALKLAMPGDVVVVTGKGAEEMMMIKGQMIPWNDRKVIEEELEKM